MIDEAAVAPEENAAAPIPENNGTGKRRRRSEDAVRAAHAAAPRLEVEPVLVTPEMARHWLDTRRPEFQRPLRPWHVKELAEAIERGAIAIRAIKFCQTPDGHMWLTDGQHMLHAVCASGQSIELPVITFRVNTMQEVEDDYTNTDRPVVRTKADAMRAHDIHGKTGMKTPEINAVSGAVKVILDGFQSSTLRMNRPDLRNIDRNVELVQEWAPDARRVFEMISDGPKPVKRLLMSQAVLAVAMITARHQPPEAAGFWRRVATGEELQRGAPEHTLREHLLNLKGKRMAVGALSRQAAAAWNAAQGREDLTLRDLSKVDATQPIKIDGTPYDGESVVAVPV